MLNLEIGVSLSYPPPINEDRVSLNDLIIREIKIKLIASWLACYLV